MQHEYNIIDCLFRSQMKRLFPNLTSLHIYACSPQLVQTIGYICLSLSGFASVKAATAGEERAHATTKHSICFWIHIAACFGITHTCKYTNLLINMNDKPRFISDTCSTCTKALYTLFVACLYTGIANKCVDGESTADLSRTYRQCLCGHIRWHEMA